MKDFAIKKKIFELETRIQKLYHCLQERRRKKIKSPKKLIQLQESWRLLQEELFQINEQKLDQSDRCASILDRMAAIGEEMKKLDPEG